MPKCNLSETFHQVWSGHYADEVEDIMIARLTILFPKSLCQKLERLPAGFDDAMLKIVGVVFADTLYDG